MTGVICHQIVRQWPAQYPPTVSDIRWISIICPTHNSISRIFLINSGKELFHGQTHKESNSAQSKRAKKKPLPTRNSSNSKLGDNVFCSPNRLQIFKGNIFPWAALCPWCIFSDFALLKIRLNSPQWGGVKPNRIEHREVRLLPFWSTEQQNYSLYILVQGLPYLYHRHNTILVDSYKLW